MKNAIVQVSIQDAERVDVDGFNEAIFENAQQAIDTISRGKFEVLIYSLEDFCDVLNDDGLNQSDFWFTHIVIKD